MGNVARGQTDRLYMYIHVHMYSIHYIHCIVHMYVYTGGQGTDSILVFLYWCNGILISSILILCILVSCILRALLQEQCSLVW